MKFGLMTQIQIPRPWTEHSERNAYWNTLDQAVAADEHGFDYFWLTEQHFFIEIGHSACPEMVLAALSQRTKTIRLGFGVILMPLHHPYYIAERVATLDVLSNGRAEFGVGRGTSPYMVEPFGFDPANGREVGRECLDAVIRMLETEKFPGFKGKHFDLPARNVVPRPIQRPHPPLWVAASNLETFEHAGRQGMGLIGVTRQPPAVMKPWIDRYRQSIRGDRSGFAGRFANEHVGAFTMACCDRDDKRARALACQSARWYYGDNETELNPVRFATAGGVQKQIELIRGRSDDELIDIGMALGGNPDSICRQLEKWVDIGLDQIVLQIQVGTMTHDQVMRSIKLIGDEVIPKFATKTAAHAAV